MGRTLREARKVGCGEVEDGKERERRQKRIDAEREGAIIEGGSAWV